MEGAQYAKGFKQADHLSPLTIIQMTDTSYRLIPYRCGEERMSKRNVTDRHKGFSMLLYADDAHLFEVGNIQKTVASKWDLWLCKMGIENFYKSGLIPTAISTNGSTSLFNFVFSSLTA